MESAATKLATSIAGFQFSRERRRRARVPGQPHLECDCTVARRCRLLAHRAGVIMINSVAPLGRRFWNGDA